MLMIVGDYWTEEDENKGRPLSGSSGKLLASMLAHKGIDISCAEVTCVFNRRIGDLKSQCVPKADGIPGLPPLFPNKYCPAHFAPELTRLFKEIRNANPTCILALGNVATWALLKAPGIKKLRGAPLYLTLSDRRYKVLPTYHPTAVFKDYSLKPILHADLDKLSEELKFADIRRPSRSIWIEPSLDDLVRFEQEHLLSASRLSIDIETSGTMITCIGFAPSPEVAIVVPFTSASSKDGSYWGSIDEELRAIAWCRKWCNSSVAKVGQNFLYDMQHLWRNYGIRVGGHVDDTMLLHHALQPELEKGLGFLGSIYTREASWKFMRHKETIKRED
jgi:uracil-DNA glycosylase